MTIKLSKTTIFTKLLTLLLILASINHFYHYDLNIIALTCIFFILTCIRFYLLYTLNSKAIIKTKDSLIINASIILRNIEIPLDQIERVDIKKSRIYIRDLNLYLKPFQLLFCPLYYIRVANINLFQFIDLYQECNSK